MHGAYVFAGVSNFWKQNYLEAGDEEAREEAGFHCYYRAHQALVAMDIVSKYDLRTAMGRKVSEVIAMGIDEALAGMNVSPFAIEDAQSRLRAHGEMFARFKQ